MRESLCRSSPAPSRRPRLSRGRLPRAQSLSAPPLGLAALCDAARVLLAVRVRLATSAELAVSVIPLVRVLLALERGADLRLGGIAQLAPLHAGGELGLGRGTH